MIVPPTLQAKNVTVRLEERALLNDVTLTLPSGSMTVLLGPTDRCAKRIKFIALDFVQRGQLSYPVPFEVDWQTQGASPMIDGGTRATDLGDDPRGSAA